MEEVSIPASQPSDEGVFTPPPHARLQSHFSSSASQEHVGGETAPVTESLGEVPSERSIAADPMSPACPRFIPKDRTICILRGQGLRHEPVSAQPTSTCARLLGGGLAGGSNLIFFF